ncbi:cation:proton antiporter [Spirochaetia bacterium 38H-sp]|uniref:Cation:proton antiporter n=1 Tax=Rarispira pelagica TaxID=3141764 RepID=A0ABU9U942_9SPIR
MSNEHVLIHLAIILILAKYGSALFVRLKMPPVLGMLLAGLLLGPSGFGFLEEDVAISWLARLGVIFLLFAAGLETDVAQLRRQGKVSSLVALGGVILPFVGGMALVMYFGGGPSKAAIMATMLTATSVSVTVMALIDLNRLRSPEGTTIMGAAVIDDVIGFLILTFVFAVFGGGESIWLVIAKVVLYFVGTFLIGNFLFRPFMEISRRTNIEKAVVTIGIALCFVFAWAAEQVGVAEITGAYLAGLYLGQTEFKRTVLEGIDDLGQSFFVSIFFINIGLETYVEGISGDPIFIVLLVILALFSKLIGSGLGAKLGGFSWLESLRVGIGMIPRGEVALIVASMAMDRGIFTHVEFSITVLIVVVTAILPPPLLKLAYQND